MKSLYLKDKIRRQNFKKRNNINLILKYIINNEKFSSKIRYKSLYFLRSLNKNDSITRLTNRCSITYRSKSTLKKFGLSRLAFRKYALRGYLSGVKKSSW